MMIKMEISSILHEKIPNSRKNLARDHWDLPEGINVQLVLEMLNLTEVHTILVLNGRQGDRHSTLNEGDILKNFFAVTGG